MKNKLKITAVILSLFIFAVFMCSCSLFSPKQYTVAYDISKDPINLDPQTAFDEASLTVVGNVFEGLFSLSETGEIVNAIAKSYTFSNNIYTFTLRDDVLWENGEKVTAYDFAFGFKRLLSPDTNSQGANQFYSIKNAQAVHEGTMPTYLLGVKALSEYSLQIELSQENFNFLNLLTSTFAFPCNEKFFLESKGKYGLDATKILANGPFNIYSWKHDSSVKLKKSETYYDNENVLPSAVNLYINSHEKTAQRLLDNIIDVAFISHNEIEPFHKKAFNMEPIENSTWGILYNCNNKILENQKIRLGISKSFDRNSYKDALSPDLTPATAIVPNAIMLFDKSFREIAGEDIMPKYNVQEAITITKEGLNEIKHNKLEPLNLIINKDIMPMAASTFSFPSQVLQRELSLFINIEELTTKEYNAKLINGDFDLAFYGVCADDYKISSVFEQFSQDSNRNYGNYKNLQFDDEYNSALVKTDKAGVIASYKNAEKILAENPPFIPMFYATDYFVCGAKTSGVYYNLQTGLVNFKSTILK